MHDETIIVRERQKLIREFMDDRGILLASVQRRGGWNDPSTVQSWFPGTPRDGAEPPLPQVMSVAGLYRLIWREALPLDLLSLMLPSGFTIVRVPENVDHDEISALVQDYLRTKEDAHRPDSPAGRDIAECEDETLRGKVAHLRSVA